MITFKLGGGLGNQMFQYAFLYAQLKQNEIYPNCVKVIMHRNRNEDHRDFALDVFDTSISLDPIDEDCANISFKTLALLRVLLSKCSRVLKLDDETAQKIMGKFGIVYANRIYETYSSCVIKRNTKFIEGAFQSWKYFDSIREDILNEFRFKQKPSDKCKMMMNQIIKTNAVCVHVRRGDYINSYYSRTLAVCDYEYYKKGMDYIANKVENPIFYIFTNSHQDHLWIKENYIFGYPVVNVDLENPDYEELRLMSSCKHFIISNSTFSWWAQYLAQNSSKIVIAPKRWNNVDKDFDGIYMPNWTII